MKPILKTMLAALLFVPSSLAFANDIVSVEQVTEGVRLDQDADYVVTSAQPFTTTGSIDIVNTNKAVVIIKAVKPSVVLSTWMDHLYIKGVKAVDGENCQVRMFDRGAIVLPYDKNVKPLTCYTEDNMQGTACNSYTEGHEGGFMKTLTAETLNNKIRSFTLKRGYMVTFALGTGGWGYSRCFIADKEDLEINLPTNMAARVSSYRLFRWFNVHKAGLASTGDAKLNAAVGSGWCYDWATGNTSTLPDVEWVVNHIYEDWPSAAACGSREGTCHMKTNNEPGNAADDHPQSVEQVLDNWQNLMRTGMRLCSETSHDGSWGHLRAFIDSVDARGWRCDLLDLHCYWASGFDKMENYYRSYGGRPIWISEWVWGASWNKNGIFSAAPDGKNSFSKANQQKCLEGTRPILETLNKTKYVERYAYWNWEADASKLHKDGQLSLLGEYYAGMDEGLGYDASIQKVPNVVCLPANGLTATFDEASRTLNLAWNDPNGDMIDSLVVMYRRPGTLAYQRIATIAPKDAHSKGGAAYTFAHKAANGTNTYRIASYPIGNNNKPVLSQAVSCFVVSAKAKWNDVTDNYVVNAGFDNEADFQQANLTNGAENHKPATAWKTAATDANGSGGVFGVGSEFTLNGKNVPATNAAGTAEGGLLGVSQGWGKQNSYTQTLNLPAGTYRLSYAVCNMSDASAFVNSCGFQVEGQGSVFDNLTQMEKGQWQRRTLNAFTLKQAANVTLSLGFVAANSTSTTNPFLFFDYVKLEQADLSQVDDGGNEVVWKDVTTDVFANAGFDNAADFQTANLTNGKDKHLNAQAWTTTCDADFGSSAVFKVGSNFTLNGKQVPATNQMGNTEGGVLGINQGWRAPSFYQQQVRLSKGHYRFSFAVCAMANAATHVQSRCGYEVQGTAPAYVHLGALSDGQWEVTTTDDFYIEQDADVMFTLGYVADNSTSTKNPFLFFDYVKLEKAIIADTPTAILRVNDTSSHIVAIYDLTGRRVNRLPRGTIGIVRYADGTAKKVVGQ